tara:strand:- start:352 stop:792 length:441 start_codon:yes stop_codon:yes gene_type:complete
MATLPLPPGSLANSCISFISITRAFAGASALFTPQLAGQLFGIPIYREANIIARLFGVRDLLLGLTLWIAHRRVFRARAKSDTAKFAESKRDLNAVVWMGLICDSVDVCSCVIAVMAEGMEGRAIALTGGGAGLFVALAGLVLRRL